MSEADMAIGPDVLSIWTAVRHEISHLLQQAPVDRYAGRIYNANDAAHAFTENRRRGVKRPAVSALSPTVLSGASIHACAWRTEASLLTPIRSSADSPRILNSQNRRSDRTRQRPCPRVTRAAKSASTASRVQSEVL